MTSWKVLALLVPLLSAGCATRGELRAALADLRAEQARQAAELKYLRDRLDGRQMPPRTDRPAGDAAARTPKAGMFQPVPIEDSPVEGPADAWVTVVEFTDFQCPYCNRAQPTLRQLRERFGPEIRFVVKHNPLAFHPKALPAAIAAECAGAQGQFWRFERILFERQELLADDRYVEWARELPEIDADRFRECVEQRRPVSRIERDQALATRVGANGTPAFFINGQKLVGAQPYENFEATVLEELARAKASGIPARVYYERAVEKAPAP